MFIMALRVVGALASLRLELVAFSSCYTCWRFKVTHIARVGGVFYGGFFMIIRVIRIIRSTLV